MSRSTVSEREVIVQSAGAALAGSPTLPDPAAGLVLLAHGSGSSRFSRRNRFVARVLVEGWLATLLFDLLTTAEERIDDLDRSLRFDIPLLSRRLIGAIEWACSAAALPRLGSPTLFVVGGWDDEVLQLNRQAAARLIAPHALQVVPGASHLFEEPATPEQAAHLARTWFLLHLRGGRT
ncbi:hypothetical protein [Synechococcus sp. CBW1107]|uniref:hypothetical protein n=1 Tax=Synechococcus sp. CBW1107 TaxID=2789857 RepID=UPI002AD2BA8B|nr:hypothetical protein [Synechococcus sp. CBW1107]